MNGDIPLSLKKEERKVHDQSIESVLSYGAEIWKIKKLKKLRTTQRAIEKNMISLLLRGRRMAV